MSDNLTIFGTDFTGVTGIKATGTGNGTLTYIRPTGTKSITSNGTGIDVTEYAAVDVAVPTGTPRTSTDLTVSGDTVTAPAGYYASAASKSVASGTAGTPTATKGSVSNHAVSVTPSVTNTTGYITGSTKTGTAVTVSASELVSGSETKTANGTYDVTNLAELVVNVAGTSKNIQVAQSTTRVANTAYTKTATLTCSKGGTYEVYWDCFRSSTSGTNGSQLYIGGNEYGTANTSWASQSVNTQSNHLTGVSIAANQEVAVYVRSRGTSYYASCGQLTIVQTA
ncbi:MAG: hypothetical protein J6S36_03700 [Eggerthellaceae bacterium]|nr:hypothetical protein [Eggerthellaceae bacterium]